MNIAILTYRTLGRSIENGHHEKNGNSVLLLQADTLDNPRPHPTTPDTEMRREDAIRLDIEDMWKQLLPEIDSFDKIVFYYGHDGAERSVELAKEYGIAPEKLVPVCCKCRYDAKEDLLEDCGYRESEIIPCACLGQGALHSIYVNALNEGVLRSDDPYSKDKLRRLFEKRRKHQ